ncbi:hypothetical protein KAR91_25035 [Candidatus Pacearchaeota archaeon]|nr:hypothetical protein [Candidatus Pacearchaeota archaeon]
MLNYQEKERANKVNSFIRNYALAIEMTFTVCPRCKGTGLSGTGSNSGGYSWNGEFCNTCEGVGYTEWTENKALAICDNCGGAGRTGTTPEWSETCPKCKGNGIMDWLTATKLGIKVGIHD